MLRMTTALAALVAVTAGSAASAADLRMSWWGGDARHVATQEALKICGARYGHDIKAEFGGWSGFQEKFATQMAGGTEADILQINWPWLPIFSKKGDGFADLTAFKDQIDLAQWSADDLAAGTVDGKLNGIPVSTTGRVMFFNKTQWDKAGLPLPKTWADVLAAAPVFKEKLGQGHYPFEATGLNALFIVTLAATQITGKDMIDPETGEVAWSVEDLTRALEFYKGLVDAGAIRPARDVAAEGKIELFESPRWASGDIAGTYEWDSTYSKYADPLKDGQELIATDLLTIDGATTQGVYRKPSMLFAISKNSKNPEAAAEIINCLLAEPEGIMAMGDARGVPSNASAAKMLLDAGKIDPNLIEANAIMVAEEGPAVSPYNENPEIRQVFLDTVEAFGYGQMDAAAAAEEIVYDVSDITAGF
ncbi:ABC transporter substrate-binding protein [Amaricoccus sp.]|uniref:ABC transporter substrate-binding protein n=1 Tax=Amaricoccus sp. TaxID=1872485 RepID=UPI001B61A6CB|nr:ABC transporter substrate-binding protein [Amaricoccus sp.]MBP7003381.1 carbohydrate ABC transporter substrate-binding protein [Amaricoccus sp.]